MKFSFGMIEMDSEIIKLCQKGIIYNRSTEIKSFKSQKNDFEISYLGTSPYKSYPGFAPCI